MPAGRFHPSILMPESGDRYHVVRYAMRQAAVT